MIRAALLATLALASASAGAETVDEVAARYRFAGEMLVAKGDRVLLARGYGTVAPEAEARHRAGQRWRLASITKQVTAALILKRVGELGGSIDDPAISVTPSRDADSVPGRREDVLTVRQLLTHHSGYANPDDTAKDAAGVPAFYRAGTPDLNYCLSKPALPGAAFSYNNCDYALLGRMLTVGDGKAVPIAWPRGMAMARAGEFGVPGFVAGKPEPAFQLASWGAAGGLMGTARAVFDFDRSLMTGKLLPAASLAALWTPEGNGSYQALGQWVFPGRLKGCAAPKRIVQRDGEIYGVQARNFIFPDDDLVVIVFTNRSSDAFPLGEVWEGKGFVYDLLSTVACA